MGKGDFHFDPLIFCNEKTYQVEIILQVFVGIVDTQLFKTVLYAEVLETENI